MPPSIEVAQAGRDAWIRRRIESGELVSNAPFRERIQYLEAHDPEFSLVIVCIRLADLGFPKFIKKPSGTSRSKRMTGDTSHLQRMLGMRDQSACHKYDKNGKRKRYEAPKRTTHIEYEMGVALCRALGLDPVDCDV